MFHVKLDGNAENGWMGEVHDGNTLTTHNPEGETLLDALSNMLKKHFGIHPPVAVTPVTEPDEPATPPVAAADAPEFHKMPAADLKDLLAQHDEPYVNKPQAVEFLQAKADEAAATPPTE